MPQCPVMCPDRTPEECGGSRAETLTAAGTEGAEGPGQYFFLERLINPDMLPLFRGED